MLLHTLISVTFALRAFAIPFLQSTPTDTADSSISPLNATIFDQNGKDITSLFQIKLYHDTAPQPSNSTVPTINLDDRDGPVRRLMNNCPTFFRFVTSSCAFKAQRSGTAQQFKIICHATPFARNAELTGALESENERIGSCLRDEICVNTFTRNDAGIFVETASCVKQTAFESARNSANGRRPGQSTPVGMRRWGINPGTLPGSRVSMMMTKTDGTTPLEVEMFDVEGKAGGELMGVPKGANNNTCTDCLDLETGLFAKGTDSLNAEARMAMSFQSAATTAGILWLALVSG